MREYKITSDNELIADGLHAFSQGVKYVKESGYVVLSEKAYCENGWFHVPILKKEQQKILDTGEFFKDNKKAEKKEGQTERSRRVQLGKMNRDEVRMIANTYGETGKSKKIMIEKIIEHEYPKTNLE